MVVAIRNLVQRNLRIVGALAHVDMVVRVNRSLASKLSSHNLDGSVGDDLVDVHVRLGSRSGLEDDEGEVVDEFTRDDLVRGLADGIGDLLVHACRQDGVKRDEYCQSALALVMLRYTPELTVGSVDLGGGLLQNSESLDERSGHSLLFTTWRLDDVFVMISVRSWENWHKMLRTHRCQSSSNSSESELPSIGRPGHREVQRCRLLFGSWSIRSRASA